MIYAQYKRDYQKLRNEQSREPMKNAKEIIEKMIFEKEKKIDSKDERP